MKKASIGTSSGCGEKIYESLKSPRQSDRAVAVNSEACRRIASFIQNHTIPDEEEDTPPSDFTSEQVGNFYLFTVAICHQTSPSGQPPLEGVAGGEHKRGWDYLSAKLEAAFRFDAQLFTPDRWSDITAADLRTLMTDQTFGDRLTDPAGRAMLLRDLGHVMLHNGWRYAEDLYIQSAGNIANGEPNLLGLLHSFAAYQDPVKKKSYFFLMLMRNFALWRYVDDENIGPPVDYHETRGHLRLGTVVVNSPKLREKLINRIPVTQTEDVALRRAVHGAILMIRDLAPTTTISQLHYLFWNVFRSCCSRQTPHCAGCPESCELPQRYVHLSLGSDGKRRCPFSFMCGGVCDTHALLQEHVFNTDYY